MKTTKGNNKKETCMSCLGTKHLYDGINDAYVKCKYCKGKGKVSKEDNEYFLDNILINN